MKYQTMVALVCLLSTIEAQAKSYPELTRFVSEKAGAVVGALSAAEPLSPAGKYALRRFFLRLQAKAGFDIEAAKIELIPELELVFQKE